jgi:hypothetical protein
VISCELLCSNNVEVESWNDDAAGVSWELASSVGRIVVVIGLAANSGEEFHTTVARSIEISVRVLPLAVWWALLFVAPAARIRRLPQKRSIILGYVSGLSLLVICSALGYELKHEGPRSVSTILRQLDDRI